MNPSTVTIDPQTLPTFNDMLLLGPVLILTVTVLVILLGDVFARLFGAKDGLSLAGQLWLSVVGTLTALVDTAILLSRIGSEGAQQLFIATGPPGSSNPQLATRLGMEQVDAWKNGALVVDHLALAVTAITCVVLLMTLAILWPYLQRRNLFKAEVLPLLLLSAIGAMLLGFSRDLLVTFIAIEILSLPLYVLCGLDERREAARESSLKYFLLGAFASGFFIYGAALLYGAVGHLNYLAISINFRNATDMNSIALIGAALVGAGFAFKLALVPFQAWVPDVYQGAPTPITAFMASSVKLGIFVAVLRFIADGLQSLPVEYWRTPLAVFAVASMVVGNLFALHQESLKRLLAYSAITHTGYLALALCVGNLSASTGMLVYLVAYYLASFGAFTLIAYLAPPGQDDVYLDELHELSRKAPGTAAALVILLLSMIGMPVTAGFMGKLMVFTDAWRIGLHALVIIAVLNSVVSAYFYLKVILAMYMQPRVPGSAEIAPPLMEKGYLYPAAATIALTILFGIAPELLILFSAGGAGL